MPTKRQMQIINNYAVMMTEAKLRLECIKAAASGIITILPPPALRELCFVQLRMLCELIALGCLVAHGDIPATHTKKLQREWSPDRILLELEKLHPYFYPQPSRDGPLIDGVHRNFEVAHSGFLTKTELLDLYGKCGNALHRGTIRSLFTPNSRSRRDYSDILEWRRKINNLLSLHLIALLDGSTHLICVLRASDHNNETHVAIAEAVEGPPPSSAKPGHP